MEAADAGAPLYTSEITDAGAVLVGVGSGSDLSNEGETDVKVL
jgi:hypothetical protein